ncbi:hypothetical protein GCK32_016690 [Trichostrongylus colubriformis]|uniref:Uncharacterized protein n=1 Tax=Trichostrongylus colubriformis TaxID=6319 RepID=A0AAN8J395_TRICO
MQPLFDSQPFSAKLAVTTPPKGQCIANLEKEFKQNDAYFNEIQKQVDETNINGAYDVMLKKAGEMCTSDQVNRLKNLLKKYDNLRANVQALAAGYSKEVRHDVLKWIKEGKIMAIMQFLGREGMAAMRDQSKSLKLMQTSFDLAAMQLELLFNPI